MNYNEMTVDALKERRTAILAEIEKPDADLDALGEEIRSITEELDKRSADEAKRAELRAKIAMTEGGKKIDGGKNPAIETRNTPEYINAFANYVKTGSDKECRALLTENATSGTVPVPDFVYEIIKTAWENEQIMSLVTTSDLAGNLKVGFERSATGAEIHDEGDEAIDEETLGIGIVTLVPESIKKWITISDEAYDLGGEAFLRYIYNEIEHQIVKKAADVLIGKIKALGTTSTATAVSANKVTAAPGVGVIAQALGELSDEAVNPVAVMNKATWATFKAAQAAANYGQDIFEGVRVVFNNSLPAYSSATAGAVYTIVGDFGHGALANFPKGRGVTMKFDDKTLAEEDLVKIVGRIYVGLDAVADKAFALIAKPTT